MSEQLAFIRKKGGGLAKVTEKVLWTNPSPSASFAQQAVTLSDSIDNYDYIAIKSKPTTGNTDPFIATYLKEDVRKSVTGSTTNHNVMSIACNVGAAYVRRVFYTSDTQITFDHSYQINAASTGNAYNIPLQVLGLNIDTDDKVIDYEIVALGEATNTVTTAVSVTLNDSLSNYAYIVLSMTPVTDGAYIPSRYPTTPLQDIVEVDYFKRHTINGAFVTGNTGSASHQTTTFTYVDDTHITYQKSTNPSRPIYVYGIKATRKEVKKPEKYDVLPFQALPANTAISFTTKGGAKAIWITCKTQSSGTDGMILTNVNPYTGEIDNNTIYRTRTASLNTFNINTGRSFTVTNGTISSSILSSSAYYISCAYTYE